MATFLSLAASVEDGGLLKRVPRYPAPLRYAGRNLEPYRRPRSVRHETAGQGDDLERYDDWGEPTVVLLILAPPSCLTVLLYDAYIPYARTMYMYTITRKMQGIEGLA